MNVDASDNPQTDATTPQVGMTLAEIAYADPQDIPAQLAYPIYATKGQWVMKWLGISAGNQMYVCQNKNSGQWAVVVRGSAEDPFTEAFWIDWFEQDLTDFYMVSFPQGGSISWGTDQGLQDLLAMQGPTGLTLVEFLQQVVQNSSDPGSLRIAVIGHSLGGCLASVLAPTLYQQVLMPAGLPSTIISPVTFAAPTAGDSQFASYVEGLFNGYPFRYENSLDVAPHSWSLAGLDWILQSYQPSPLIPDYFTFPIDGIWLLFYAGGYDYTQPGAGVITQGQLQNDYWWVDEVAYQHSGETYLHMYDAPPVHFPLPKSPYVEVDWRQQRLAFRANALAQSASIPDPDSPTRLDETGPP